MATPPVVPPSVLVISFDGAADAALAALGPLIGPDLRRPTGLLVALGEVARAAPDLVVVGVPARDPRGPALAVALAREGYAAPLVLDGAGDPEILLLARTTPEATARATAAVGCLLGQWTAERPAPR